MEKMEILVKTIREWKIISVKQRKTLDNQLKLKNVLYLKTETK
jgi:hypothetical protein